MKDPFKRKKYRRLTKREKFLLSCKTNLTAEQIEERKQLDLYLGTCAEEIGVKLVPVEADNVPEIEILYDVFCNGYRKVGHLLKQWNSCMIRLGTSIHVQKKFPDIALRFRRIHHLCGVHHISLLYPPETSNDTAIEISMETAINLSGLNEDVLEEMIERFEKCLGLIQPLLE